MNERISEAIVIVDPDQAGARPACTQEYGDAPVLVHVLRQLKSLGIDHVTLSASRAHERSVRPIVAGFDDLPVCEMVAGPRQGPDSSAAAFVRSRRQIDSSDLLITRASILSEPGSWLEQMLSSTASNVAVIHEEFDAGPPWLCPASTAAGTLTLEREDAIGEASRPCLLSGTYALRSADADSLYSSLTARDDTAMAELSLEAAVLEWVSDGHEMDAIDVRKTAWLCAETAFWP